MANQWSKNSVQIYKNEPDFLPCSAMEQSRHIRFSKLYSRSINQCIHCLYESFLIIPVLNIQCNLPNTANSWQKTQFWPSENKHKPTQKLWPDNDCVWSREEWSVGLGVGQLVQLDTWLRTVPCANHQVSDWAKVGYAPNWVSQMISTISQDQGCAQPPNFPVILSPTKIWGLWPCFKILDKLLQNTREWPFEGEI